MMHIKCTHKTVKRKYDETVCKVCEMPLVTPFTPGRQVCQTCSDETNLCEDCGEQVNPWNASPW